MFKDLSSISQRLFSSIFFYAFLFLVFVGTVMYLFLGKEAKDALVAQMLHREQADARVGAASIAGLFELVGNAIVTMSSRDEVVNPGPQTDAFFNSFLDRWKDTPLTNIFLVDKNGKVAYAASSELTIEKGVSVADREYFVWAKNAANADYYVSGAIISRLGGENYYVVPIASPILDKSGNFNGALVVEVSVSHLAQQYVDPLKISDKSEIYLVKADGTFIYAPFKELLGENFFTYLNSHKFLGSEVLVDKLRDWFENIEEGKVQVAYPSNIDINSPLKSRLLAYTPVNLKSERWILVLSTPEEDALIASTSLYFGQGVAIFLIFLAFLGLSMRIAKYSGYRQAKMGNPNKKETSILSSKT
jgi:C4-dicarboxylate-specific signal transduction histidine kinase